MGQSKGGSSGFGGKALTFPASLAMNAVSDDVPSCLTSCASNSLPSHTIAAFIAGKLSGMVQMQVSQHGNGEYVNGARACLSKRY
jgi:hypothetical protein